MTDDRQSRSAVFERAPRRPDRPAILSSAGIHLAILTIAVLVSALTPEPVVYETVMIEIVSPPPAPADVVEEVALEEDLEVDTPEPEPEDEPEPEAPPAPAGGGQSSTKVLSHHTCPLCGSGTPLGRPVEPEV